MRKKVGWRARALYIVFALALVVGMVPLLAAPVAAGEATIDVTGPPYTKLGQVETFQAVCDPVIDAADQVTWSSSGALQSAAVQPGPGTVVNDTSVFTMDVIFNTEGVNWVKCVAEWGQLTQEDTHIVFVGDGLMPQIAWNVIGADEEFCVPDPDYTGSVQNWSAIPDAALNGSWDWVGGDPNVGPPPLDDCVSVRGRATGELALYALTDVDILPPIGPGENDTLLGVKKWGKINFTEIYWVDDKDTSSSADDVLVLKSMTDTHNAQPGEIGEMIIGDGKTQIVWDEEKKQFEANETFVERVWGTFVLDPLEHPANGAEVFWWILAANAPVHTLDCDVFGGFLTPGLEAEIDAMQAMYPPAHTNFVGGVQLNAEDTKAMTVSGDDTTWGDDGDTSIVVNAEGEEAIKIVIVSRYPEDGVNPEEPEFTVCPEIISWNFWTQQLEKVPQVRWAGEKIVLEKEFGSSFAGYEVLFSLENQSPGCLEPLSSEGGASGCQEAWTTCDSDGVAKIILVSESPGEVDVDLAIFDPSGYEIFNQHGFVVFFLKFEELELGNVEGDRVDNPLTSAVEGHNSGIWDPENPYLTDTDTDTETLNVSEDTMLRARVSGWFMGDDLSTRPETTLDLDGDTVADMTLPAGRWVLPEDWAALAGPLWQLLRPHWDIMIQPTAINGGQWFMSDQDGLRTWNPVLGGWTINTPADKAEELGPYMTWIESPVTGVSMPIGLLVMGPVIGPYSSLDNYTPFVNPVLGRKTILRDAKLNWWDAPMPPAKIGFLIMNGPGFLKETDKGDVYYHLEDIDGVMVPASEDPADTILYTNPFYQIIVPASDEIPAFINNGGYDWDSWQVAYGPYDFWEIFNQPPGFTPDDPQHPTFVEVYSDNHGEAMVYLNGDWNLDLSPWMGDPGEYDVPYGTEVGVTSVIALGDYPYFRKHPAILSANVTKTWEWGQEKLFDCEQLAPEQSDNANGRKLITVWVSDRDGFADTDMVVDFRVATDPAYIEGFLDDITGGDPVFDSWLDFDTNARTVARVADAADAAKFAKAFPAKVVGMTAAEIEAYVAMHYAVTGVIVTCDAELNPVNLEVKLHRTEGTIIHTVVLDFQTPCRVDPEEPMSPPWNLVIYQGADAPVPIALTNAVDSVDAVWHHDNATKVWSLWSPDVPAHINSLTQMETFEIYWIRVSETITWSY